MAYASQEGITSALAISEDNYTVVGARNKAVATFLQDDYTHLLFVDEDVLVPGDTIVRLGEVGGAIACGCYPGTKAPDDRPHMFIPYIMICIDGLWRQKWFKGIKECEGAGTGCMLIERQVFETLGYQWFDWPMWLNEQGQMQHYSDDIDFCRRARDAGFKVYAHGDVRCGHMKEVDVASFIVEEGQPAWNVDWQGPQSAAKIT
jgi:GT2 family glycosyltransferase